MFTWDVFDTSLSGSVMATISALNVTVDRGALIFYDYQPEQPTHIIAAGVWSEVYKK